MLSGQLWSCDVLVCHTVEEDEELSLITYIQEARWHPKGVWLAWEQCKSNSVSYFQLAR